MARGIADSDEAAELMAEADEELRLQDSEADTNVFVSVKELRQFVKVEGPLDSVFVSVVMCVLAAERLPNNKGTRVTFIDGFMQPHFKSYSRKLDMMDMFRRDARVVKITVWDLKDRSTGKPRFRTGIVYEVKEIHAVKFYHDVLQGNVQAIGSVNPGLIEEFEDFEVAKRAKLGNTDAEEDNDELVV